jgi:hypothetical protein
MTDIGAPAIIEALDGKGGTPANLLRGARILVEHSTDNSKICGYMALAIYSDGTYSCGWQRPEDHPLIGQTLFAAFVREVVNRELIGPQIMQDFDEKGVLL